MRARWNAICVNIYLVTIAALALATGCVFHPKESSSNQSFSKPVIQITYSAAFAGQTASGYLSMLVDINIKNNGYEYFNISPGMFSVFVDRYSYSPVASKLDAVRLADGGAVSGKLTFQVPPEALSTRVGYQMACSEQDLHNLQWIKAPTPLILETNAAAFVPVIAISYSESFMWVKETSSLYLLVDMTIENRGYESFNTSPKYFSLVLGDIFGESGPHAPIPFDGLLSDQRDGSYSDMRSFDLQDGGQINGRLAFKVPTYIFKSTESWGIKYSGVRTYNIQWAKRPPKSMN